MRLALLRAPLVGVKNEGFLLAVGLDTRRLRQRAVEARHKLYAAAVGRCIHAQHVLVRAGAPQGVEVPYASITLVPPARLGRFRPHIVPARVLRSELPQLGAPRLELCARNDAGDDANSVRCQHLPHPPRVRISISERNSEVLLLPRRRRHGERHHRGGTRKTLLQILGCLTHQQQ